MATHEKPDAPTRRYLFIDALRGVAALAVVLFHASEGGHIGALVERSPTPVRWIFEYGNTGVFMFFDLVMAGIGVCDVRDIALSVLATVIGQPAHNVTLDTFCIDVNEVTAGETMNLRLTVTNHGPVPLYRLFAITKSEDPLFDNRQLVIGRLDPGRSRSSRLLPRQPLVRRISQHSLSTADHNGNVLGLYVEAIQ